MFIEDVRIAPEHAFYVDRKGDGNNKAFSEMYHHYVAYYPKEKKPSLGLGKMAEQQWLKSKRRRNKSKVPRYCSRESAKIITSDYDVEFCGAKDALENQLSEDVLVIGSSADDKASSGTAGTDLKSRIYDESTLLYVRGKGKEAKKCDDESGDRISCGGPMGVQIKYYNRTLRENPNDINLWLEFVDFQSQALEAEVVATSTKDRRQIKIKNSVLIGKKLAILEKAVSLNPSSVELAVYRLRLSEELWENSKVESEWKNLAFVHPNSILMWKCYLLYAQSNLQTFTSSHVTSLYVRCLSILHRISDGEFKSHKAPENLEISMIGMLYCFDFSALCFELFYLYLCIICFVLTLPRELRYALHLVKLLFTHWMLFCSRNKLCISTKVSDTVVQ